MRLLSNVAMLVVMAAIGVTMVLLLAGPATAGGDKTCPGTYVTGSTVDGNVSVTGSDSCTIEGGEVKGNIEGTTTGTITVSDATVKGNISNKGGGDIVVTGSTVDGNVEEEAGGKRTDGPGQGRSSWREGRRAGF